MNCGTASGYAFILGLIKTFLNFITVKLHNSVNIMKTIESYTHFKCMNFMVCKAYLNKAAKKVKI